MNREVLTIDVAIIGGGFGASLLAIVLRQRGRGVALLERGKHPRFAIGESSTPLANLLLEELAATYDWPTLAAFSKWGTWQRDFPDVACGLKRGFTFLGHQPHHKWQNKRQLLVAASPHDAIADTHWYRPDFDDFWMRQAQKSGAIYRDFVSLEELVRADNGVILRGKMTPENAPVQTIEVRAQFVVDASGPRGALHRLLDLKELSLPHLAPRQALYSHFSGVARWSQNAADFPAPSENENHSAPFAPDDAALHHLFEGGWMWVLRFNNGLTSAGVSLSDQAARDWHLQDGEAAWHRILKTLPSVKQQFIGAQATEPFRHAETLSFRSATIVDPDAHPRWALLPSAAGFIDPLLSTGFPQTLLGVSRLAQIFDQCGPQSTLKGGKEAAPEFATRLREYGAQTERELLAAAELVGTLLEFCGDFAIFRTLSLLYFAAASWSETARRLGRPHLATSFLLLDHPHFGPHARDCLAFAREQKVLWQATAPSPSERVEFERELQRRVFEAIAPIDVGGWTNAARYHRYPVEAADLRAASELLQVTSADINELLQRSGFELQTDS